MRFAFRVDAYVVVEGNQTALDVLTRSVGRDWIDRPAVERRAELNIRRSREPPEPGGGKSDGIERAMRHGEPVHPQAMVSAAIPTRRAVLIMSR